MRAPSFTRSLRFRLSGMTVAVAFGIGGLALGAVYLATLRQVRDLTVRTLILTREPVELPDGSVVLLPQLAEGEIRTVEGVLKEIILNRVAVTTLAVLVGMLILSLVVGWFVAGRTLAPLTRITEVAEEIEATDLSRRIGLEGPDDELTRMARTFDAMLDRLDRAFSSQRKFLAQTSHDLRTPLSVIRSNLDVTLSDPDATIDDWRATGEVVVRAAERMSTMIEDLTAAARLEVGGARLVPLDLAMLVADTATEVRAAAAEAGVRLEVRAVPATVEGDRTSLLRALGNLVENALRLAPEGSEVVLASGTQGPWAYLAVADRGPGIDPQVVRGEAPGRTTGLGLAITREIASAHRGRLDAALRPVGGSLLVLWIPRSGDRPEVPPDIRRLPLL